MIFLVYILFEGFDVEKKDDNKFKLDRDKFWIELKDWYFFRYSLDCYSVFLFIKIFLYM